MNARYASLVTALVLLSSISNASASSSCPCSRENRNPGILVGFYAWNGTTTDVLLYDVPEEVGPGTRIAVTAAKNLSDDIIPVENLELRLYSGSRLLEAKKTDKEGLAVFIPAEPGEYIIAGGDASASFVVPSPEPPIELDFSSIIKSIQSLFDLFDYATHGQGVQVS